MNTDLITPRSEISPWGSRVRFCAERGIEAVPFPGLRFARLALGALLDLAGADGEARGLFSRPGALFLHAGGWQSWSPGWELAPGEFLPRRVRLIPDLLRYTARPGEAPSRRESVGHFITYLRAGDTFLCLASREGDGLCPLSFYVDRAALDITLECCCPGKSFAPGETVAEFDVFLARGYFAFKDTLRALYGVPSGVTRGFAPEGRGKAALPGGYESWYYHYTHIDEGIITKNLQSLQNSENLVKLRFLEKGAPAIFQIDDGWERAVGDWDVHPERFPRGLAPLAAEAERAGLAPGLWIAPFLVTRGARVFREKPEWILRDAKGKPVRQGWNPGWDGAFYCLDLSRKDVLDYLAALVETAICEWGFRYLKLDFLYAGFAWGAFAAGGTPSDHYRRACEILTRRRQTPGGKPVTYLGCGIPFGPSRRFFPLSRTGADTLPRWDDPQGRFVRHEGRPSALINLKDTLGRAFMDGTIYLSDPDVIFLRGARCEHDERQKELIALTAFLFGSQIMFSDDCAELTDEDRAFSRRIAALYDTLQDDEYSALRTPGPQGAAGAPCALGAPSAYLIASRSGRVAGLANLEDKPLRLRAPQAGALYEALRFGRGLVDHRVDADTASRMVPPAPQDTFSQILRTWTPPNVTADAVVFEPRSITLVLS
ncbi:MAG: alpha-galactosidase [Treponema sp.]|jgi:alpha-galactosidase|nr:alpha-galactosidase [Treponema sp.]